MRIDWDVTTGRLLLDEAGVGVLRAWLDDGDGAAGERLARAGVIEGEALHPALAPVADALGRPFCHLALTVGGAGGVSVHRTWASPGALVTFAHVRDDVYEVLLTPPEFVAAGVARLARLAVRPRLAAGSAELDVEALAALFAPDARTRAMAADDLAGRAPESWHAWAEALRTERWRAWRLDVLWVGTEGTQVGRQLTVVDTGAGAVEASWAAATGAQLVPTTATALWKRLVGILPTDDELQPADAVGARVPLA
ncbi:hypothetical protein [Georgenia wangjunii]|uniref:hypothetical protein n=1 Tax=Georgenia wangjunii TaxID=3117730 RepID=UPI002F26094A